MYDVYLLITPGDVTQVTYSLIKKCTCNNIAKVNNGYVSCELGLRISISKISPWISFWGVTSCDCQVNQTRFQKRITCGSVFLQNISKKGKNCWYCKLYMQKRNMVNTISVINIISNSIPILFQDFWLLAVSRGSSTGTVVFCLGTL